MFDFSALKESQTAIHTVGHSGIKQRCFNHTALRVAAVEHSNFMAVCHTLRTVTVLAFAQELLHFFHHPLRFCKVGGRLVNAHRFARTLCRV